MCVIQLKILSSQNKYDISFLRKNERITKGMLNLLGVLVCVIKLEIFHAPGNKNYILRRIDNEKI